MKNSSLNFNRALNFTFAYLVLCVSCVIPHQYSLNIFSTIKEDYCVLKLHIYKILLLNHNSINMDEEDTQNCPSSNDRHYRYVDLLREWNFNDREFSSFPLDEEKANFIRRNVKNAIFSQVNPTALEEETRLGIYSENVLEMLDLDDKVAVTSDFKDFVSGTLIHPSSTPFAHRYGGHQFGWWAEQLGDGRAHLLGVYINK